MTRPLRHWERGLASLNRIDRILHGSRVHLSKMSEQRLVDLLGEFLKHGVHRPPWLRNARLATTEEDYLGIDVVVGTDKLELFLQVKSSDRFKKMFVNKGYKLWRAGLPVPITGVIIVNDHLEDKKILGSALSELNTLRSIVQIQGGNYLPVKRIAQPQPE